MFPNHREGKVSKNEGENKVIPIMQNDCQPVPTCLNKGRPWEIYHFLAKSFPSFPLPIPAVVYRQNNPNRKGSSTPARGIAPKAANRAVQKMGPAYVFLRGGLEF